MIEKKFTLMEKSILLIEDEYFIRDIYTIALKKAGYDVDTAADGQIAIQKADGKAYDLILLDIMLPKITGIDVLKHIKQDKTCKSNNSPIIITTNLGQENILQEAMKLGAIKSIMKAEYNLQEFVAQVDAFFGIKRDDKAKDIKPQSA